jgi:SAM-dependent methyltransferase
LLELFRRLVTRDERRSEADIQSDVRQFILTAPFELEDEQVVCLETAVGDRRRIDVEVGSTVIEVKRDLRRQRIREEAIEQLAGYVATRSADTLLRYVGVLTDGTEWLCYHLVGGMLQEVSSFIATPEAEQLQRLIIWLEGVLATAHGIAPTAEAVAQRLGAQSSAHALDKASLKALYERNRRNPTVMMKRELWARLLSTALGTQFQDSDDLFIEHTLLVNSAEIIAHGVLGFEVEHLSPTSLLSGAKFDESGIYGVVEQDFFDWVVEVDDGPAFVRTLARRLNRFVWSSVEQDVLKVLYESIIQAEVRKSLGEYYTPDWLVHRVIESAIPDPLRSRVLDPACGSGTFLFHAVRRYIDAAQTAGMSAAETLEGVTQNVSGIDLHPVAVTLARVTFLLAIGRELLIDPARGAVHIPVYLGDSLQWNEQNIDIWSSGGLVIHTTDDHELFASELRFPAPLLRDAARFDDLVKELARRAAARTPGSTVPSLNPLFIRLDVSNEHRETIERTFATMCRLHDEGRDHIWGYYIRNLARPMWLATEGNRVDVLVGNPPWLAYRNMSAHMQATFRRLSDERGLWASAKLATQQDLSGLFVVRACELYLRPGGYFGMVLPNAALDREAYAGFRRGFYGDGSAAELQFEATWDLRRIRPHFFPRAACVVFGRRTAGTAEARPMPEETTIWSGRLPRPNASWAVVEPMLAQNPGLSRRTGLASSPYSESYLQGATLTPRLMFVVEEEPTPALGLPAGRRPVRSSRSVQEKAPWRSLPTLSGVIESEFVRSILNGENLLPYRTVGSAFAVLPCTNQGPLRTYAEIDVYPGLSKWWARSTQLWEGHRTSDRLSLLERVDYQRTLSAQFPIPELRVIYNRSGMHICAAKVTDRRAVIANGLYWSACRDPDEADYVCGTLNSPVTTELTRPLMSYGKDERDIHRHVWELPIPRFETANPTHQRIASLAREIERACSNVAVDERLHFAATRRAFREHIEGLPQGEELNTLIYEMLSGA